MNNTTRSLKENIISHISSKLWENQPIGDEFSSLIDFGASKREIETDEDFLNFLKENHIGLRFDFMGAHFIREA